MAEVVTLAELGITEDPGRSWHPKPRPGAYGAGGTLPDLTDAEVVYHLGKPEALTGPEAGEPLAAEDSAESPEGVV